MDLARRGFAIENEWYWKITENAETFDVTGAVRDFLAPLARCANDTLAITDVAAGLAEVRFKLGDKPIAIQISAGLRDRVAVNHFVGDLNRALSRANLACAFALVVPRRYELRGVLLAEAELAQLAGDPRLLVPSSRPSWRSIPTP
jgi:hypothetical protein